MANREFIESRDEIEQILHQETLGYLGLSHEGVPYVVPLNYSYLDGKILFHCALSGKKLDYIRANPNVCFSVGRQTGQIQRHAAGVSCHVDSDSVICYGTARIIDDPHERQVALNAFNHSFRPDAKEITLEEVARCGAVEIEISEMTGRRERQEERLLIFWRYTFQT
jgi:nitroimidazol reductase NimA-like FMN-containing flavoprotein (pyridoxamine 5'-phosphate oxidase superfamily)